MTQSISGKQCAHTYDTIQRQTVIDVQHFQDTKVSVRPEVYVANIASDLVCITEYLGTNIVGLLLDFATLSLGPIDFERMRLQVVKWLRKWTAKLCPTDPRAHVGIFIVLNRLKVRI